MTAGEKERYVFFVCRTVCLTTCKHRQQIKFIHFFHNKQAKLSTDNKCCHVLIYCAVTYSVSSAQLQSVSQCLEAEQIMLNIYSASGMLGMSISCCQQAELSQKMSSAWICTLGCGLGELRVREMLTINSNLWSLLYYKHNLIQNVPLKLICAKA